jgi:uncharacterized protein YuzE
MIEMDENGRVLSIRIKPEQAQLCYAGIAVWTPVLQRLCMIMFYQAGKIESK